MTSRAVLPVEMVICPVCTRTYRRHIFRGFACSTVCMDRAKRARGIPIGQQIKQLTSITGTK